MFILNAAADRANRTFVQESFFSNFIFRDVGIKLFRTYFDSFLGD